MEFKKTSIKLFDDAPKEELVENINYFSGSTVFFGYNSTGMTSTMAIPPEMPTIPRINESRYVDRTIEDESNYFTNLRRRAGRVRQLMYGRR